MAHFNYHSLDELKADIHAFGLEDKIPLDDDFSVFTKPLKINEKFTVPRRFAVHPMEGFDSDAEGRPGELAFRRYARYARGGFGLIWFEATAVLHEARSNPSQFWLHEGSWETFAKLLAETKKIARETNGFEPLCVIQLTHSGRYSRPEGTPKPLIAHHSLYLDPIHKLPPDYPLVTDDYLDRLQDTFVNAAKLAQRAGFDGIDLKGCHRYLMSELFASHTREGKYGGSLENRTRLMRETLAKIKAACPGLLVTTRMNIYDALPYPYGFAMQKDGSREPDLNETNWLIACLKEIGIPIVNLTIANPYYEPYYGRPFDTPIIGAPDAPEHPLQGVARFIDIVGKVQKANPDLPVIGTGYTWLRQFLPYAAAATLKLGKAAMIGLGRGAFAYFAAVLSFVSMLFLLFYKHRRVAPQVRLLVRITVELLVFVLGYIYTAVDAVFVRVVSVCTEDNRAVFGLVFYRVHPIRARVPHRAADESVYMPPQEAHAVRTASFINKVYGLMTLGLFLTAFIAHSLFHYVPLETLARIIVPCLVGELILVIVLSVAATKLSAMAAFLCFIGYAALNGVTLSTLFYSYRLGSIAQAFFITGGTFGVMSLYGLVTKRDLTSLGNLLLMGLFGLIITSLVNLFLKSSVVELVTSVIGIIIFVGLTAYDTQKIKKINDMGIDHGGVAVIAALSLYLDFINLFLYILRFTGRRK